MQLIKNRSGLNVRGGYPRAVKLALCANHGGYFTFAGECACAEKSVVYKFAVIGTDYGWLHNTAGEVKTFLSESGARRAAKCYATTRAAELASEIE